MLRDSLYTTSMPGGQEGEVKRMVVDKRMMSNMMLCLSNYSLHTLANSQTLTDAVQHTLLTRWAAANLKQSEEHMQGKYKSWDAGPVHVQCITHAQTLIIRQYSCMSSRAGLELTGAEEGK